MPQIYALLVGINNYPKQPLQGCINDATAVEYYLKTVYPSGSLHVKKITDHEVDKPERAVIIKAFDFFAGATAGDTCLFYYSGHGSSATAPNVFWTSVNGRLQSFVCSDSRLPGGKDLMDKEMSFLIWQTLQKQPGIHFVAITDCCYSGTITRDIDSIGITDRMLSDGAAPDRVEDYLGYEIPGAYVKSKNPLTGEDRITVMQGQHIHLAASGNEQTSKELQVNGNRRGAFTYSLLKTLYACNGQISYRELVNKTNALVCNMVPDQNPRVNINGGLPPSAQEKIFLSAIPAAPEARYLVYQEQKNRRWCLQAGLLHGLSQGDRVRIEGLADDIVVAYCFADYSVLAPHRKLPDTAAAQEYYATVTLLPDKKLLISCTPGLAATDLDRLLAAYKKWNSGFFVLSTESPGTYIIRKTAQNAYYIGLPGTTTPVFEPVIVNDDVDITVFFSAIDTVAKWLFLLEFQNAGTNLSNEDYSISLYCSNDKVYSDINGFDEVPSIPAMNELHYRQKEDKPRAPAFRLLITNHTKQPLWVSNAYLGFDYSIETGYFNLPPIGAGKTSALLFVKNNGETTDTIVLKIDDEYRQLGYTGIKEYLKLFISCSPIALAHKNQAGLALTRNRERGDNIIFTEKKPDQDAIDRPIFSGKDWKTETIGFHIIDHPTSTATAAPTH